MFTYVLCGNCFCLNTPNLSFSDRVGGWTDFLGQSSSFYIQALSESWSSPSAIYHIHFTWERIEVRGSEVICQGPDSWKWQNQDSKPVVLLQTQSAFNLSCLKSMFKILNSYARNNQASHAARFPLTIRHHCRTYITWPFYAWNQYWNRSKVGSYILSCFLPSCSPSSPSWFPNTLLLPQTFLSLQNFISLPSLLGLNRTNRCWVKYSSGFGSS